MTKVTKAAAILNDHEDDFTEDYKPFYDVKFKSSGEVDKVTVNYKNLITLLFEMGFQRYDVGRKSFIVRIDDNVIEEMNQTTVVDHFVEYINQFDDEMPDLVSKDFLLHLLYKSNNTFFAPHVLNRLKGEKPIRIQNHTKERAFFYYKNGFVEVTKDGYKLKPYADLEGMVWKDQIIDRDFTPVPEAVFEATNFAKFVRNISNAWEKRFWDDKVNENPDYSRYQLFKGIIGNGLHSFFEGKLRAVILTDSRITEEASGRTGKTLIMKALGHMLNANQHSQTFVEINGKDFDQNDRFKYQELSISTRLLHINDVKRGFDFEGMFNDITEGVKVQYKNEAPFIIPAKMYISTNLTIKTNGDSAKDRSVEFELADYYCADHGPDSEFKQWFFADWDTTDWNRFDNFMLSCVQQYLAHGMERPPSINLATRKLQQETCPEFILFLTEMQLKEGEAYNKKEIYERFLEKFPDWEKIKQRTFTKWLNLYAEHHPDWDRCEHPRRNGVDFFEFYRSATAPADPDKIIPDTVVDDWDAMVAELDKN